MFDWGGVIEKTPRPGEIPARAAELFGVERDDFMDAYYEEYKAVRLGTITHDQFWVVLSQRLERPIPENLQNELDQLYGAYNELVIEFLSWLRDKGIKVSVLSNVGNPQGIRSSPHIHLFDDVVLSADVGMAKPDDMDLYKLTPDKFGVNYNECLMVDDLERNLEIPRMLGMKTILAEDEVQIVQAIRKVLKPES